MSNQLLKIKVEIQSRKGKKINSLSIEKENPVLYDLIVILSKTDWAKELFKIEDSIVKVVPGYLVVFGTQMVKCWEDEAIPVTDGQILKFIQVVAGG